MRIDLLTLFPEMCETVMAESIVGRARKKGALQVCCHQIRNYAFDKHSRVDDTLFGGGMGMLLMAEPIAACFDLSLIHIFTVIHGTGTGVLRTAIQKHLKHHPSVKSFRLGTFGEGEAGVTVVELK